MAAEISSNNEAKNCAFNLEKPLPERHSKQFIGLRNKGATCYLNSLIQAYYSTPEFRQAIFDMELCVGEIGKRSTFVDNVNKHNFLFAFQKLFVEMQELDINQISIEDVTKSFGWDSNEALQQQDVQEAIRIIFDGMEQALKGTPFQNRVLNDFKIETVQKIKCLNCGSTSQLVNIQYDLMTQIKGQACLEESLINQQNFEKLTGENQYFCEECGSKQNALNGTQLQNLPNILTISLLRFEFDKVKLQRCKLNDRFSFGLELDASLFCDSSLDDIDSIYELYSVLVHKGGAHGGHYFTYVRDFQFSEQDQIKRNSQQNSLEEQIQQDKLLQVQLSNQQVDNEGYPKRSTRRNKYLSQLEPLQQQQNEIEDEPIFDIDSASNLLKGWFNADDEQVSQIQAKEISRQFGGNPQKESAYILLYRKKSLPIPPLKIPRYFQSYIEEKNQQLQNERSHYQSELISIEILYRSFENLNMKTFQIREDAEKVEVVKVQKNWPLSKLYEAMKFNIEYSIFEIAYCENKLIQIYQEIPWNETKKISDFDLSHSAELLFINQFTNELDYKKLKKYCGSENVPWNLKVQLNKEDKGSLVFHCQRKLRDLKQTLFHMFDIPSSRQYLKIMQQGITQKVGNLPAIEDSLIDTLGFQDGTTILLSELSDVDLSRDNISYQQLFNLLDKNEMNSEKNGLQKDQIYVIVEFLGRQPKRFIMSLHETLEKMREYFIEQLSLDNKITWRLRELDSNRIFFQEDFLKELKVFLPQNFNPEENEMRFSLEEGLIAGKDQCIVTFLYFDSVTEEQISHEVLCSPTSTVKELKDIACSFFGIDVEEYQVYKVDENERPTQCIKKESSLLSSTHLKKCLQFYLLSASSSSITAAEANYVVWYYPENSSNNSIYLDNFLLDKNQSLDEIKEVISTNKKLIEYANSLEIIDFDKNNMRIREMKKNHLGSILKKCEKKFGKTISSTAEFLCVQLTLEKQYLNEGDLILNIQKRNVSTQSYDESIELIIINAEILTIDELKKYIIDKMKLDVDQDEIELAKHYPSKYLWKEISIEAFNSYTDQIQKATLKKKTKKHKNVNAISQDQKQGENVIEIVDVEEYNNLRSMPFQLVDEDEIGWRLKRENVDQKDDFQTEEDIENKKTNKPKNKNNHQSPNIDDDKPFALKLNFDAKPEEEEYEGFIDEEK